MTSAVIDDIGSLVAVAIVVPLAVGGETLSLAGVVIAGARAVLFFVIVSVIGAWIFPHRLKGWVARIPLLSRYGMVHILTFDDGRHATMSIMLVALLVGVMASFFGFHPAVGAYMAGLIIKEEYFDFDDEDRFISQTALSPRVYSETKQIVDTAAFSLIGPVFFVNLGTQIIFDPQVLSTVLPYAAAMAIGVFTVQIATAGLAARFTGGMQWHQSLMIGFGMLGRAELAFVVMDIAYVQNGILPMEAFYTLMITAFFLNVAVPITIRWWRPYYMAAETRS
jgi:Kef-type K+ transport system membrane component KefB